jgi:hypothetical protein
MSRGVPVSWLIRMLRSRHPVPRLRQAERGAPEAGGIEAPGRHRSAPGGGPALAGRA